MTEIRVDGEIILRPPSMSDADRLFVLIDSNREHLGKWLPGLITIKTVDEERAWLQQRMEGSGSKTPLLIVLDGSPVGVITTEIETLNDAADVGYWLIEEEQGRGITTRSCAAVVDDLLRVQGINRVVIRAAVDNTRSRAIPQRLGFVYEGVERQALKLPDGYADVAVYSMLASDWQGAQEMGYVDPSGRPLAFGVPPILIDNGMLLRRPRTVDAAELYELLRSNRDRFDWWSGWSKRVRTEEDAAALIRNSISGDPDRGSPLFLYDSGDLVGVVNIELSNLGDKCPAADVRYWIGGQWEGQGLMIRACQAAVDAAIPYFNLDQVSIHTGAGNMRARSLAERLGFTMQRLDRGTSASEDMVVYAVSASDWTEHADGR